MYIKLQMRLMSVATDAMMKGTHKNKSILVYLIQIHCIKKEIGKQQTMPCMIPAIDACHHLPVA
jgi:hypothetical protein